MVNTEKDPLQVNQKHVPTLQAPAQAPDVQRGGKHSPVLLLTGADSQSPLALTPENVPMHKHMILSKASGTGVTSLKKSCSSVDTEYDLSRF